MRMSQVASTGLAYINVLRIANARSKLQKDIRLDPVRRTQQINVAAKR